MEFLALYSLFLLKCVTLVLAILFLLGGIFSISRKPKSKMDVVSLNEHHEFLHNLMTKEVLGEKKPKQKKSKIKPPTLFVLDFNGDIKASQVEQLREEITAILTIAKPQDEVLIRLESPGGAVNGYGLAAAQLQRIRENNIPLCISIDKVAASGGYLMACVANKIVAAPFSIIGSIGVVAQIPNFYRWLKKHNIDVELLTAGEYKRTLTLFGENTEKGREKFKEDLEQIHQAFRAYVLSNRSQLDIEKVSTGEHWLAQDAFELKLVDELITSDEYLINKMKTHQAFKLSIPPKTSILNKLVKPAMSFLHPWG
jgi:serine protease SohB